jgi:hypothetical protein
MCKGKAIPLQALTDPDGSRRLRFLDIKTIGKEGGKFVSLKHWSPLNPGIVRGTYSFLLEAESTQGHGATGRIMSIKNSNACLPVNNLIVD